MLRPPSPPPPAPPEFAAAPLLSALLSPVPVPVPPPVPASPRSSRPTSVRVRIDEVELTAIRAQGAGGQNVNKVSSAVHLRYEVAASSLPEDVKQRLLALRDSRITQEGVLVLKAQRHRSQDMNRTDALARLQEIVDSIATPPRMRRATKPSYGSKQRRLEGKSQRAKTKTLRGRVQD